MFYVTNYTLAVVFCVVTMLCWGSWGNTQKLAGKTWRYEFFYWDYVVGVLLFSVISGLTFGSCGGGAWSFLANLRQATAANIGSALLGGVVFNAANILLSAAISIAGMSVAFPVGIGLALVLGVVVNYLDKPQGNPALLFFGVGLIVVAILCNAVAYKLKESVGKKVPAKGIILSVISGTLMAFFYSFIAKSMDMNFAAVAPSAGKMTPYSAFFVFACGIFLSTFVFNAIAMRHPVSGEPVTEREYFKGTLPIHLVGVLGGLIWGLGNGINLVAAGTAGTAISYGLGQGATLVSALWGILVWKEFKGAPKTANALNAAMFIIFLSGLGLIIKAGTDTPARVDPVRVVFDTDMSPDYDDVGALAVLHALQDQGESELLAVVCNNRTPLAVPVIEILNDYYGRPEIPVGVVRDAGVSIDDNWHTNKWPVVLTGKYKTFRHPNGVGAPDAVTVLRRALTGAPDGSVTICSVGFLTNLSLLLKSAPDGLSPLSGHDLVKTKVKELVAMAGTFPAGREWNVFKDAPASIHVFTTWPTPIIFSGGEIGSKIKTGKRLIASSMADSPVKDAYATAMSQADHDGRMSWDQTAALVAVRGPGEIFDIERGQITVLPNGSNTWSALPNGPHARLVKKMEWAQTAALIEDLMIRPPASRQR